MANNAEQPIKGAMLLDMFITIRDMEIKNARTGQFSDDEMARRIGRYIYNRVKDDMEKATGGDMP